MADSAALLHGQRRFLESVEDPVHRVVDGAHDKAVEEGDVGAVPAPARMRPAGRKR